jgi:uncharacterized surface protein with fasciclin (FAS1) repeats
VFLLHCLGRYKTNHLQFRLLKTDLAIVTLFRDARHFSAYISYLPMRAKIGIFLGLVGPMAVAAKQRTVVLVSDEENDHQQSGSVSFEETIAGHRKNRERIAFVPREEQEGSHRQKLGRTSSVTSDRALLPEERDRLLLEDELFELRFLTGGSVAPPIPVAPTTEPPTPDEPPVLPPSLAPQSPSSPIVATPTTQPQGETTTAPNGSGTSTLYAIAVDSPDLSTFVRAVDKAGFAEDFDNPSLNPPVTIFAPSNEAFLLIEQSYLKYLLTPKWILHLQNLLNYHVTEGRISSPDLTPGRVLTMGNGENVTVAIDADDASVGLVNSLGELNAVVVAVDAEAANGIGHVINGVLTPSFIAKSITTSLSSDYSTLTSLIESVTLEEGIPLNNVTSSFGPWTLLAPNNAAFEALGTETIDFLTSPEGAETLTAVLLYHLVTGVNPSVSLKDQQELVTVLGPVVTVSLQSGKVAFNDATVTAPDILAFNGISHGIAGVLTPPSEGRR